MAGIYKRGEMWWGRAQRSGKEYRRSLETRDKRVAEKRFRTWLDDMDAQAWGEKPPRSFREAVRKFVTEHFPTLKPSSAKRYASSIVNLGRIFDAKNIQQISTSTLSDFETLRRSEGASAPTIRRDLACLSSMLSFCEQWEWVEIGSNIVPAYLKARSKRGLKESQGRRRYLSEVEEKALIKNANGLVKTAIILAIETGLRDQELMSLKWSQVDFNRNVILTNNNTKSKRIRIVPLSQKSAQCLMSLPRHISNPHVFYSEYGEGHVGRMVKGFKGAALRAGIKDVCWHDLRRTAGCRWFQRDNMSIAEVSILLGHSSFAVTEKSYAFLNEEQTAQKVVNATLRTKTGTGQAD